MTEKEIISKRLSDYESQMFLIHLYNNFQKDDELIKQVMTTIASHNLSVTEAIGFLEYMKVRVRNSSYLPLEK